MKRWSAIRSESRRYFNLDRSACLVLALLLVLGCVSLAALGILSRPVVSGWVARLQPQPTPTITAARPGSNLALNKEVNTSHELPDFPGRMAVDSSLNDWWGAGAFAPQYIEIDLGASYVVSEFILHASQSPPGRTVHQLYVRGAASRDKEVLVHTFDAYTFDNTLLQFKPAEPLRGIRYIRVKTVTSPSWVGWREILVIAGE